VGGGAPRHKNMGAGVDNMVKGVTFQHERAGRKELNGKKHRQRQSKREEGYRRNRGNRPKKKGKWNNVEEMGGKSPKRGNKKEKLQVMKVVQKKEKRSLKQQGVLRDARQEGEKGSSQIRVGVERRGRK